MSSMRTLVALAILSLVACGARSARQSGGATSPRRDSAAPRSDAGVDATPTSLVERALRACAIAASCNNARPGSQALFSASTCVDWFGESQVQRRLRPLERRAPPAAARLRAQRHRL